MKRWQLNLIVAGIVLGLSLVFGVAMFDLTRIMGNEIGVKETWFSGVEKDPLPAATYFVLPWERVFVYPTSVRVFVMNDKPATAGETGEGRKMDAYLVQSRDSQDMHLSIQVQWRIDPLKVVSLHKTVGASSSIGETVLRPVLLRVVKDKATTRDAIDAYSGTGLVTLQQDIEKELNKEGGELQSRGVIVDNFVLEHIRLDEIYTKEVALRQTSIQKEKRAVQEEKTAQAEALKAKAEAKAAYERAVVQAEQEKEVQVLNAEAQAQKVVLAAEAESKKMLVAASAEAKKAVIAAEAEKEASELKAAALLALGKANAESEKLKFTAYGADGAQTYAKIQIAKSLSEAFGNIKGYLPENMNVYTLGDSFMQAVENVVAGKSGK